MERGVMQPHCSACFCSFTEQHGISQHVQNLNFTSQKNPTPVNGKRCWALGGYAGEGWCAPIPCIPPHSCGMVAGSLWPGWRLGWGVGALLAPGRAGALLLAVGLCPHWGLC